MTAERESLWQFEEHFKAQLPAMEAERDRLAGQDLELRWLVIYLQSLAYLSCGWCLLKDLTSRQRELVREMLLADTLLDRDTKLRALSLLEEAWKSAPTP